MNDNDIRVALKTTWPAYELGRLSIIEQLGFEELPEVVEDFLMAITEALLDTQEAESAARKRYIYEAIEARLDIDELLEPVTSPESFTDESTLVNIIEQAVVIVSEAGIMDLTDWRREEVERARDARAQEKYDASVGK